MTLPTPDGPYSVATYRLDESVGYLIKRVRMALSTAIDREMAIYDISHDQWGILLMIAQGGGATAAMLSRDMACDTGSMTRMIDRLEAKELLKRTRSADDRRVVRLDLTDAGRNLAEQLPSVMVRVLNRHLRGFSTEDCELLRTLLGRMLVNATDEQAAGQEKKSKEDQNA